MPGGPLLKILASETPQVREPVHSFGGGQPACEAFPQRHVTCQSDVSELLKAAKPVTWRGKGDLLQVAWGVPPKGTWLVIELWAGIGGLALSMLSIGCHFYGLAAELDPTAQACAKEVMPHVVHLSRVEHVKASDFSGILRRRKPRGVLIGGGSPCQGNSGLNTKRQGLADPRSQQPLELQRLFREFDELPEMQTVELIGLLENVASMPDDVRDEYSAWLGCDPVLIEAGTCGWAHRRRLYWLFNRTKGLGPQCSVPSEWAWITDGAVSELRFVGKKPVPPRISWEQGYRPLFDAVTVIQQAGEGAFHPFTREFFHPDDRIRQSSPEAVARFYADARRFPPSAYEEGSLLWKSDQWRQPSADERSQIMGIPPAVTRSVPGSQSVRTQVRNSLLGNGFHLPSIMILLTLIPFLCEAKMSPSILPADEQDLRDRVAGTVWEPGRLESFPGLKGVHELVDDLQHAFPEFPFPSELQSQLTTRLQSCALAQLQAFPAWLRGRGLPWEMLGPLPVRGRDKSLLLAGLGGQRYSGASSRGLDHVLPPGLSKEDHILQASSLESPFRPRDWPELDIAFVVYALQVWQGALPRIAQRQRDVLRSVARALSPLEAFLDTFRSCSSKLVAADKRPGFIACMSSLLRWPDVHQARHMVVGFPIVGELEDSGVFRSVIPETPVSLSDWLGEDADVAMQEMCLRAPPRHADVILAITQEEQRKGYCSPFFTKLELDDRFGVGQWRAFGRFLLTQADGKQRAIDDARKSGHNSATCLHETIHTVHLDFIAAVAGMVDRALPCKPSWFGCRVGTDDLPEAYRGLPVSEDQLRYSIVCIFLPGVGWRFSLMYGLAYGLGSAVISFNRFPSLGIAISRRCTLAVAASYFDDELSLEFMLNHDVSQRGVQCVFTCMGAQPQAAKSFVPSANRHYLGASVHVGDLALDNLSRFQPKASTVHKVNEKLQVACTTAALDRDTAGRLRGDVTWMFSLCAGNVGKVAGPLLSAKQHGADPHLTADDIQVLRLLQFVTNHTAPRDIYVRTEVTDTIVVYSDASFEDDELRLGWIIFDGSCTPVGGTCAVPQPVLDSWVPRNQQIFPGESLCGLLVPWIHHAVLSARDVLWFVDNEAAVASLIRGSSQQPDVHTICQFSQVMLHTLGTRVWWEWINSESNPSDGLSRLGLSDPWSADQGWLLAEYEFPPELLPHLFFHSFQSCVLSGNSGIDV